MSTLSYSFHYSDFAFQRKCGLSHEHQRKAQNVIQKFKELREEIFKLRYEAEQVDLDIIEKRFKNTLAEFQLIMPAIQKLSDCAEFISGRELADWERCMNSIYKEAEHE